MPACLKANYPATPIIIHCTVLFIEMPYSLVLSHRRTRHTRATILPRVLLALLPPRGILTFISCLYGGHISDNKITQECGLNDLLESSDVVMVYRGFDIQHLLASKCVTLNKSSCHLKRK